MLAEVQALVTPSPLERPRRTTSGLDGSRVAMVLAVLEQHCGIRLHDHDVFASTVGGAKLTEPASDLARRDRAGLGDASAPRRPPAWSRWARSAWPASCAGSATCRSGWPRRPGSASGSPSCPASRPSRGPARRPQSATVDGMRVVEVARRRLRAAAARPRPREQHGLASR